MRAVPRLYEFHPGICLTTDENARKNLSQGKKPPVRLRKPQSEYSIHITKTPTPYKTHTLQNPHIHTHTHTHITKQYKTTTVQIKINTVQYIPK